LEPPGTRMFTLLVSARGHPNAREGDRAILPAAMTVKDESRNHAMGA